MSRSSAARRPLSLLTAALAAALVATTLLVAPAHAATITVATAIGRQDGSTATVRGYVVGQPTAADTVVRSNFPNDYALAIADSASETSTGRMLYVQVPSAFRSQWGLRSNPGLMGRQIDVTGTLTPYFSPHPGLKDATAFAFAGSTDPSDPGDPGGTEPPGYYDAAEGLTGSALKSALHNIIDDHTRLSYDQVWTALKQTDEDPNNSSNVIEIYSRRSISKTLNGGDPDDWNREHVWAQSHGDFGTVAGPGTDIHHLRPEDVTVNSARGSLDFDLGGSAVSQCSSCYRDGDSFEPPASVKGDVARMLFYMAVRYNGDDGFADLELDNDTSNGGTRFHGRLSVLLAWHAADPVSASEIRRNDLIYGNWQHNRNPFIDHPEYAERIW